MLVFNLIPVLLEVVLVVGLYYLSAGNIYGHVTICVITIYILFTYYINEWRTNFRRDMNDKDTESAQKAVDSLINFETVKYFTNEKLESERFHVSMRGYENAWVKIYTSLGILNFGQAFIIAIGLMIMMLIAAQEVLNGTKTLGEFVLINTLLVQLYSQLNFLGTIFREIKQSLTDMENMFNLLDEHKEVVDCPQATPLKVSEAIIEFKNVHFSYNLEREILKGIDFIIPAGKTIAVVGHSGAGKSTLTRLLFRFYDVTSGGILIDGQNIQSVTQESLRQNIGIVPQDTVLFNDTIAYNIGYGRNDATFEEIQEAAKIAQIHDFIQSLPEGYYTQVGERGLKLSGGEKQRIAISRTILKNPAILIFDEATSALDTATENAIQKKLYEISKDRTTLIIAHRLSTVIDADEIIILDNGKIVEQGKHHDLIAQNGHYARMWQKQQQEMK
jgi:ATP-binding cassette subfamily B protein